MKLWILLGAVLLSLPAYSQESVADAMQKLSNTQYFAAGASGYAGQISEGEKCYKVIRSQAVAAALASFEKLYATGNPQAKAYALAGIRKLNRKRFKELR